MTIEKGHHVLPVLSGPPATPMQGEGYFDSGLGRPRYWDGAAWFTPGAGTATGYTHVQSSASAVWTVSHNLGRNPVVTVINSVQEQVLADVDYVDGSHLTIMFNSPLGGTAYMI